MNVPKRENNCCKIKGNKVCAINEFEISEGVNIYEYIDTKIKVTSNILAHVDKLIATLSDRIKKIEKNIEVKELEGKLNKHYEQSRRRK